jgi:hypothetical protein
MYRIRRMATARLLGPEVAIEERRPRKVRKLTCSVLLF